MQVQLADKPRNPVEQTGVWSAGQVWSNDFTHVIGLTPTGRATIEVLQLNRSGLVNLRRALYALGEHPPQENEP